MKKFKVLVLLSSIGFIGFFDSCVDTGEDNTLYDEFKEDSTAQAIIDSTAIIDFIADNGIIADSVVELDYGISYVVTNPETSTRLYEPNELVSYHIVRMFEDGQIYSTSNGKLAIKTDSLAWVSRWTNTDQSFESDTLYIGSAPQDTVFTSGKTIETILTELSNTKESLDYTLYTNEQLYLPLVVNYVNDGSGLNFSLPFGFRIGMTAAMNEMRLGSSAYIMCPSAVMYGTVGDGRVPPNTVVIHKVDIVNIRP